MKFDLKGLTTGQILEALTNEKNREATKRSHTCKDWELYYNPSWLLEQFVVSGEAKKFKERHDKVFPKPLI